MPRFDFVIELKEVEGKTRQEAADRVAFGLYVERRPVKTLVYLSTDGPNAKPHGMMILPPGTLLNHLGLPLNGPKGGKR